MPTRVLELIGRPQPAPGRVATIAPSVPHPVTTVFMKRGDRVKAGQPLVKQDDRKQQIVVRAKQTALAELQARLARLNAGPSPAEGDVRELEARVETAKTELGVARSALKKYTLVAGIDGMIAELDVSPGQVPELGTTVWGEIVDLRQIDVRVELTPDQADSVPVGRTTEIRKDKDGDGRWTGRVVFVGIAADPKTERVPALVRLDNPGERLRCAEKVKVTIPAGSTSPTGK